MVLRSPSFDQFCVYVERFPAALVCWREPAATLYPLLAWINTQLVVEARATLEGGRRAPPVPLALRHHNQAGIATTWALQHLGTTPARESSEPERLHMLELAGRYWTLHDLLTEVRQGIRGYEAIGTRIRMPFTGDRGLDALDRMLGIVDHIMALPDPDAPSDPRLATWLRSGPADDSWTETPLPVRAALRDLARHATGDYPRPLPGDLDLGGFTLDDVALVWAELLARAMHAQFLLIGGTIDPAVAVPICNLEALAAEVADQTRLPPALVAGVIELLTTGPGDRTDPCLAPLVQVAPRTVVLLSGLIVPGSPFRNITALVQQQPARFGEAGRHLGAIGAETVAATIRERIQDARVGTGIKLRRGDGADAGDLDVVVFDEGRRTIVVFEVMWRIAPDGATQIGAHEEAAQAKRLQVARVREELASGTARLRWPRDWPGPPDAQWRWYIVTPSVLPVQPSAQDGVTVRSHQLLARMLRANSSIEDLVTLLDHPPLPPVAAENTAWARIRYGDYRVDFEGTVG